jgi:Flp pilus assembly protein TadG
MMMMRRNERRGSALVETAVVYPVLFLLVLGIILMGISVFRYQQVAHAAREGARYAIVHGYKYAEETGNPAATDVDIFDNAIHPQMAKVSTTNITYAVTWDTSNKQVHNYVYTNPATGQTSVRARQNTVSVTVRYSWDTGFFGVIPVQSTTVMPMSY